LMYKAFNFHGTVGGLIVSKNKKNIKKSFTLNIKYIYLPSQNGGCSSVG
jgi:hypothetical protein